MAFSGLFGKKKGKEAEPRGRASSQAARSAEATGSSNTGSSTTSHRGPTTKSPPTLSPRDVARATAEKIDFIESQIESEIMQSRTNPYAARATSTSRVGRTTSLGKTGITATHPTSYSTDLMLGDSRLAHSMELSATGNPAVEEAAILYANGQDLPAVAVLSDAVREDRSTDTWLMLLELFQSLGKRNEFEDLAIDYAVKFETSAPAWSETHAKKPIAKKAESTARAAIVFKGALDSRIIPQLEKLKTLAQRNSLLYLEFDQVASVDTAGAELILRVFAAFQKSNHEVAIRGAGHLTERLQAAIEVGRRDPSNAVWMLLLEVYRILGRRAAFEETSIDYCVTYEVSPPSWEPASPKYRIEDQAPTAAPAEPSRLHDDEALPPDTIALAGEMLGRSEGDLQRLTAFATNHEHIVIDCARLTRVDFTAAGLLLNWAVGMRGARKDIAFTHVGHLVSALFVVMGLHEIVPVVRSKV